MMSLKDNVRWIGLVGVIKWGSSEIKIMWQVGRAVRASDTLCIAKKAKGRKRFVCDANARFRDRT